MTDQKERELRAAFVAAECQGIQPTHEVFYLHSILYAADRAYDAFRRLDDAVADGASDVVAFACVQEALTHAAAVSRFFWPMAKGAQGKARGHKLRQAFGLNDASPLRNRRLRNAFEHFDEDLDGFLLEHDAGTFFPDPRVGDHTVADEPTGKIFKLIDPKVGICVLLGQKFDYKLILGEIEHVLSLAGADVRGRLLKDGETQPVDPQDAFGCFHAKWTKRLGLKSHHIDASCRRGRDRGWNHLHPEGVPSTPGHVRVLLLLESASLVSSIEPAWIDEMVEEWRQQLAPRDGDHRKLTRLFISQSMALNRHRGREADLLICAALWLIMSKEDAQDVVVAIRRGDVEVRYDIAFLDDEQQTRFRFTFRDLR